VAADRPQDKGDIQIRDMIGDKYVLPVRVGNGFEYIRVPDTYERHPDLVPDITGMVYIISCFFRFLKGKDDYERKYAKHTGDEEQEGIYTIEPPKGFYKDPHT
jgi:hypothetical protein